MEAMAQPGITEGLVAVVCQALQTCEDLGALVQLGITKGLLTISPLWMTDRSWWAWLGLRICIPAFCDLFHASAISAGNVLRQEGQ